MSRLKERAGELRERLVRDAEDVGALIDQVDAALEATEEGEPDEEEDDEDTDLEYENPDEEEGEDEE